MKTRLLGAPHMAVQTAKILQYKTRELLPLTRRSIS